MGDDVFRDPIREVLVLGIRAEIQERQDSDGRRPRVGRCAEGFGEGEGGRPPVGRDLGERLRQRLLDAHRHGGPQPAHRGHGIGQALGDQGLRSGSGIWRLAREHLVQHAAETVHVAASVQGSLAHRLLRTHVGRRPHREPCLGEALVGRGAHRQCDPEVRDHCFAFVQQDVLHVPMDHVVGVRVAKGGSDLPSAAVRRTTASGNGGS
jgi:hypothetical protein